MKPTRRPGVGRMERKAWVSTLGASTGVWMALSLFLPLPGYVNWLIATGAITLVSFVLDKRRAQAAGWRIPERVLLALMVAGGVFGAWGGMKVARHKTRKPLFRNVLWASTALHLVLLLTLLSRG